MKRSTILIAVLLTSNASLLGYIAFRAKSSSPAPLDTRSPPPISAPLRQNSSGRARDLSAALTIKDHAALRDFLRDEGFPEDLVRLIVQTRLDKDYKTRREAIQPKSKSSWWKDDPRDTQWNNGLTKAQLAQLRELEREQSAEAVRILGPDMEASDEEIATMEFLRPEQRLRIQKIEQDYAELRNEIEDRTAGFRMPSDLEKFRLLEEEQMRDIYAVMSPEEQKAYELRVSSTAKDLRWDMTAMDASEQEYLKIFPIQKAFDDRYRKSNYADESSERSPDYWKQRNADEKAVRQQMIAIIGAARVEQFIKNQDYDYRQLQAAASRFDLPGDTPDRVYALRKKVADASQAIAANTQLTDATKKEALVNLVAQTRDQVRAHLGTEVAAVYLKEDGMSWLTDVEEGNALTFSNENERWETHPITPSEQPPIIKNLR